MATIAQPQMKLIPSEPMRIIQIKVTEEAARRIRIEAASRTASEGRNVTIGQIVNDLAMGHLSAPPREDAA